MLNISAMRTRESCNVYSALVSDGSSPSPTKKQASQSSESRVQWAVWRTGANPLDKLEHSVM